MHLAVWFATVSLAVPFVAQDEETCGAASLSMVMRYWGKTIPQAKIAEALREPRLHGILGSRLSAFAREEGFLAIAYEGDIGQLRESMEKGRPLIVAWKIGRDSYHNVVVIGIDDDRGKVLVNDPSEGESRPIALSAFEKKWAAAGHWTLLVLPQEP